MSSKTKTRTRQARSGDARPRKSADSSAGSRSDSRSDDRTDDNAGERIDDGPRRAAGELRVATYNIHKGVLREFFGLRRSATIHELRNRLHALDADLIFLQEVQGLNERMAGKVAHWPSEPQHLFLSRSSNVRHTFEAAYGKNATYLHGHHGNALLSRFSILSDLHFDVSDHALEKRGVLHCVVGIEQRQVHCFVVHFGLLARSRERQLEALLRWIEREVPAEAPLIIAGDFNDWRNQLSERLCSAIGVEEVFDSYRRRTGVAQRAAYFMRDRLAELGVAVEPSAFTLPRMVRTARTYPALVPWLRMDRIYQRGFSVSTARVLRGPEWARLSDHSPLVADLSLVP